MTLHVGGRTLDLQTGEVVGHGILAQRELALLRYFLDHPDRVLGPDELLREVWGFAPGVRTRAVYTSVYRLRSLIEEVPNDPKIILSERGNGYRFRHREEAGSFPTPLDLFFGRDTLFEDLRGMLTTMRFVTLVGAPGIGKTRMAQQLGSAWHREDGGCALFISGRKRLFESLATGLGIAAHADPEDLVRQVEQRLGKGRWLVVVDDVDGYCVSDRIQIADWARLGEVTLLTTARSPLGLPGEQVVEVGPIGIDASVALLSARVAASVEVADPTLRALATRLEGIPLALELAASLLLLLGAAQSLALLEQSLAPLALATSPEREGLDAAIERSWVALHEQDQGSLLALAVFRGGFTIAAASGVLGNKALAVIVELRRRSLLFCRDAERFGMFDAVREYAQAQADPGDWQAAEHRHAAFFTTWLSKLPPSLSMLERRQRIQAELPNLQAAVETLAAAQQKAAACNLLEAILTLKTNSRADLFTHASRGIRLAPDAATRQRFEAQLPGTCAN